MLTAIETKASVLDSKHLELETPIPFAENIKVILLYESKELFVKEGPENWEDFFIKIRCSSSKLSFTRDEANER